MPEDIVFKPTSEYDASLDTPKQAQKDTIIERLLKYGTLISKNAQTSSAVVTLYVVPPGKTFFLVSSNLVSQRDGSLLVNAGGRLFFEGASTARILNHSYEANIGALGDIMQSSASFPVPLKVSSGIEIGISVASTNSSAQIQGYEIDNEFLK